MVRTPFRGLRAKGHIALLARQRSEGCIIAQSSSFSRKFAQSINSTVEPLKLRAACPLGPGRHDIPTNKLNQAGGIQCWTMAVATQLDCLLYAGCRGAAKIKCGMAALIPRLMDFPKEEDLIRLVVVVGSESGSGVCIQEITLYGSIPRQH